MSYSAQSASTCRSRGSASTPGSRRVRRASRAPCRARRGELLVIGVGAPGVGMAFDASGLAAELRDLRHRRPTTSLPHRAAGSTCRSRTAHRRRRAAVGRSPAGRVVVRTALMPRGTWRSPGSCHCPVGIWNVLGLLPGTFRLLDVERRCPKAGSMARTTMADAMANAWRSPSAAASAVSRLSIRRPTYVAAFAPEVRAQQRPYAKILKNRLTRCRWLPAHIRSCGCRRPSAATPGVAAGGRSDRPARNCARSAGDGGGSPSSA